MAWIGEDEDDRKLGAGLERQFERPSIILDLSSIIPYSAAAAGDECSATHSSSAEETRLSLFSSDSACLISTFSVPLI